MLETNNKSELTDFKEKPSKDFEVSMGIYMLNKDTDIVPENQLYGFDDLMKNMLKKNLVNVSPFDGYW